MKLIVAVLTLMLATACDSNRIRYLTEDEAEEEPTVIDEEPLSSVVHLAQTTVEGLPPGSIADTELGIAITGAPIGGPIFFPQQLQCHPFALQLLMDRGKVGFLSDRPRARCPGTPEPVLQFFITQPPRVRVM